jgi:hypothetical protein
MGQPNLTVLCYALVTRLVMSGKQASGVEIVHDEKVQRIAAGIEPRASELKHPFPTAQISRSEGQPR